MNNILFVSAFININRNNWSKYNRSLDDYFKSFIFLAQNLDYNCIVFIEKIYYEKLKPIFHKKNIIIKFIEDFQKDLFITKYLNIETFIINSKLYKNNLNNKTKNKPEHNYPKYNLVNHDKVNFVKISKKLFPKYNFYGWLDFGFLKERNDNDLLRIPKNINFHYLHNNKILYQSLQKNIPYFYPLNMIKSNIIYIQGTMWIISNKLVNFYQKIYEIELLKLYEQNIVDDDQNIVYQLIFKYDSYFDLYYNNNWFNLFKIILNKPIKSKIKK